MEIKSFNDSFIYRLLNTNDRIQNTMTKIMTGGSVVGRKELEEAFVIMNKMKFPLKQKVMDAYERGDIVLIFSPDGERLPSSIPFVLQKSKTGKVVATVFVDIYGHKNKEQEYINIDAKKLYTMMEGAYIALVYFKAAGEISKRAGIIKNGSNIYANMIARVLAKNYALNVDKIKLHKVQFLASKFFIISILKHKDDDLAKNYAMANCVGGNPMILEDMNSLMKPEDYTDIATFIQAITRPEFGIGLDGLTVRGFIEQFINMYEHTAVFSLELFQYFIYNVNGAVHGSYINNQYILDDIVVKHGPKLYQEILSLSRI